MNRYEAVEKRLRGIAFDRLWPGFHAYRFALYDDRKVYLSDRVIPVDERFKGNTAIAFEGQPLAIWNVATSPIRDADLFASKLVHEMFHAHQMQEGETRFPDEFEALRLTYGADQLTHRFAEDQQLIAYLENKDEKALDRLIGLRKSRRERYPRHLAYEERIEVVEGMAHYVEMLALKQLDRRLYERRLKEAIARLKARKSLVGMRARCYDSGALILLCFENRIRASHGPLGREERTLLEIVDQGQTAVEHHAFDAGIVKVLSERMRERERIIDRMKNEASYTREGSFRIIGFDPLNSWVFRGMLYCEHFLMVEDAKGETHAITEPSLSFVDDELIIDRIIY
ncbi:MAG: hypothetical protein ACLFTZ_01630 [Acholeplasmataceae bacterium]